MFHLIHSKTDSLLRRATVTTPIQPKLEFAIGIFDLGAGYAATMHTVNNNGTLSTGKPTSMQSIVHTLDLLTQEQRTNTDKEVVTQTGWIDKRVIFEDRKRVVWVANPVKRDMWFRYDEKVIRLNPYWPRLVFKADKLDSTLHVYSTLKASVSADTKLYHAPLANIGSSGVVCQGSARRPEYEGDTNRAFLDGCEAVIYDSNFTHVNHPYTFAQKGNTPVSSECHIALWRNLDKEGRKLQRKDLVDSNIRIADLIK